MSIGKSRRSYVTIKIQNKVYKALIDSGATCSVVSESFYEAFLSHLPIGTSHTVVINGITHNNNNKVYSLGTLNISFFKLAHILQVMYLQLCHT